MKVYGNFILLIASAILSGCTSIITTTTSFYVPNYKPEGTIAVLASNPSAGNSLEFDLYKSKVEEKLSKVGYVVSNSPLEASYVALLAYGIDTGKAAIVSTPIYGQTSGGTAYHSGSVYGGGGFSSYSGSSYTMPTYGVVGSASKSITQYTRAIAIDIFDAASFKAHKPKTVYEIRAKSTGRCGDIASVFSEMLEGMFMDFPGKNGKPRTREIMLNSGGC